VAGWLRRHRERTPPRQDSDDRPAAADAEAGEERPKAPGPVPEIGGPKGPEPTRYGDWEKGGRCTDF
jgi:hypothetical protein